MRLLIFLCLLTGCSGYRFTQQENPLLQYGIQSLSVPMFYNYSTLADTAPDFTRETYRLLSRFSGLKLMNGYDSDSDAVLIGIIKSPERLSETLVAVAPISAQGAARKSLGERRDFNIPSSTNVRLWLQVIVIKKPTEEEITLLRSGIGEKIQVSSRIIFNEHIPLSSQYQREIMADAIEVSATQNQGIQRRVLMSVAQQAALSIRDMILYAY